MIKTGPNAHYPASPHKSVATEAAPNHRVETLPSVSSEALLGARGELKIEHNGELYSLRRTRQGKLILTK